MMMMMVVQKKADQTKMFKCFLVVNRVIYNKKKLHLQSHTASISKRDN